MTHHQSWDQL